MGIIVNKKSIIVDCKDKMIFIKDKQSRFAGGNAIFQAYARKYLKLEMKEIIGSNDYDLPWPTGQADCFIEKDKETLEKQQLPFYSQRTGNVILVGMKQLWQNPEDKKIYILACFNVANHGANVSNNIHIIEVIKNKNDDRINDFFRNNPKRHYPLSCNNKIIQLSSRESQTLLYIVAGCSYTSAAARMHISRRTVESHINNLRAKLGETSKEGMIQIAIAGKFINNFQLESP